MKVGACGRHYIIIKPEGLSIFIFYLSSFIF